MLLRHENAQCATGSKVLFNGKYTPGSVDECIEKCSTRPNTCKYIWYIRYNTEYTNCKFYERCDIVKGSPTYGGADIYELDTAKLAKETAPSPDSNPEAPQPSDQQTMADLKQQVAELKKMLEISKREDKLHQLALGGEGFKSEIAMLD